ncbi:hypothetical protein IFM89_009068 [Coptis chinensis]|uniref:PB1 domain-containing protein n=1 Tax=Coptis chinensis TaxID=261450 RepID=A0A835IKQ2_9MAGN|nr:hypothetical protein IFM89_009068 [Coptis chinensis]
MVNGHVESWTHYLSLSFVGVDSSRYISEFGEAPTVSAMGELDVTWICYCDGELVDEDREVRYFGGHTKVRDIPSTIGFIDLRTRIQEMLEFPIDEMGFKIKCRYCVDDHTVVAVDVDDDQSLKVVLDRSHHCNNTVIAYIVEQSAININSECTRKSSYAAGIEEPIQDAKPFGRVGRPPKYSSLKKPVGRPSKGTMASRRRVGRPSVNKSRHHIVGDAGKKGTT